MVKSEGKTGRNLFGSMQTLHMSNFLSVWVNVIISERCYTGIILASNITRKQRATRCKELMIKRLSSVEYMHCEIFKLALGIVKIEYWFLFVEENETCNLREGKGWATNNALLYYKITSWKIIKSASTWRQSLKNF